jgi:hypothetical protein
MVQQLSFLLLLVGANIWLEIVGSRPIPKRTPSVLEKNLFLKVIDVLEKFLLSLARYVAILATLTYVFLLLVSRNTLPANLFGPLCCLSLIALLHAGFLRLSERGPVSWDFFALITFFGFFAYLIWIIIPTVVDPICSYVKKLSLKKFTHHK